MPATYEPIATNTLSTNTASVTFSSISQNYTDLILVFVCGSSTNAQDNVSIQVGNGAVDTGSNYSRTILFGNGSSASTARSSNSTYLPIAAGAADNTVVGTHVVHIMNYSNTTTNKSFLARGDQSSLYTVATAGLWRSTAAINEIKISLVSGNLVSGSIFTLYGIKAA